MQKLNTYFGGEISSNSNLDVNDGKITTENHSISIKKSIFGLKGEYYVNQFHNYNIEPKDLGVDLEVVAAQWVLF